MSNPLVLRGHFVLPDGRHTDTIFDKFAALENPGLIAPLLDRLAEELRSSRAEYVTGASHGGMVVASQVAGPLRARIHFLSFDDGVLRIDMGARLEGARIVIVDDFVVASRQFDQTLAHIRSLGAEVVALGALASLPLIGNDLPVGPFCSTMPLEAQIFAPEHVPAWLGGMPVQSLPDWRSSDS